MPTLNKDKADKASSSTKIKKRKSNLQRSNTFNSSYENSTRKPVTSSPSTEKKSNVGGAPFPEPRYTKAVYLLLEAKKLAREIEEKRNTGELFRNKIRGSGRGYSFSRPGTPNFVDAPGCIVKQAKGRALQDVSRRCEECGRSLGAGKYSQHQGQSYCNVPCYSMLFSSLNVSKKSTDSDDDTPDRLSLEQKKFRNSLIPKLRTYNTYYAETPFQITCKEFQGKLVLDGILKVYWGLKKPVTLKSRDTAYWRNFHPENVSETSQASPKPAAKNNNNNANGEVDSKKKKKPIPRPKSTTATAKYGLAIKDNENSFQAPTVSSSMKKAANNDVVCYKGLPRKSEKTSFVPPYGSPTTLRVSNNLTKQDVVTMLLKKFQIIDKPSQFTLFTVYESGGVKRLKANISPLIQRLSLGPCEDVSKIFIMETAIQQDVPHEVASYCNFAMYELETFLQKFKEEEEREVQKMIERYNDYKESLKKRILELQQNTKVTRV